MLNYFFVALIAQSQPIETLPTPPETRPETPIEIPRTNSGETFKDPFSNAPVDNGLAPNTPSVQAPPLETPPTAPSAAPFGPAGTPPPVSPQWNAAPATPIAPLTPSAPTTEPQFEEVAPTGPMQNVNPLQQPGFPPAQTAPKKDFNFPDLEEYKGPSTQEVVQNELSYLGTPKGTWNFATGLGMGFNANRRANQIQLEANGGYRLTERWEVGGMLSYRFIDDKILGMIATGKGYWRLTKAPKMRIDVGAGAGLGWSLRAAGSSFTEGRFTTRLQGETLFYVNPKFALVTTAAFESFIFGITSDGEGNNLMSGGGPPSQFILTVGTRWEF